MSDDWNSVTKIGKGVRGPGGGGPRETTIKGKSALNAAQRAGAVISTDKKYGSANVGSSSEGQRLTKIDAADGPVATKKVSAEVAQALATARKLLTNAKGGTLTQKDLASKAQVDIKYVSALERRDADFPPMSIVQKIQKSANVRLTGSNIGEPMLGPKKKFDKEEPASAKTPTSADKAVNDKGDGADVVDGAKKLAVSDQAIAAAPNGDADAVANGGTVGAAAA